MSTVKRIYKNTVYLSIAEVISKVLQFIIMLYAARILTQENFGKFSFALSFSLIALIFADIGINQMLVREIARSKKLASKYFFNSVVIKVILSVITFFAVYHILVFFGYPQTTIEIAMIMTLFAIFSTYTELFFSIFRSFEMMGYDAFIKITRMIILTLFTLYLLFNNFGVIEFSFAFLIVEIIVVIIAFIISITKFIKFKFKIDFGFIKSILQKAWPFGVSFIFGSIYFYIASVILSKIRGDVEVALFSAAYNLALAIIFIPNVYTNAIYPVLSRTYKKSKIDLSLLYERSFKYLYLIGLPISVGTFLLADKIILFIYGTKYAESIIALQIIAWFLFLKFINFLLGILLASINKQDKRLHGQGLTALFNIILCFILIPKYGYVGAAWSVLITEIFLFLLYFTFVTKSLYFYNFLKILIKPAIACFAMYYFIVNFKFDLITTIIVAGLIYGVLILVLRTLDKRDFKLLRQIF